MEGSCEGRWQADTGTLVWGGGRLTVCYYIPNFFSSVNDYKYTYLPLKKKSRALKTLGPKKLLNLVPLLDAHCGFLPYCSYSDGNIRIQANPPFSVWFILYQLIPPILLYLVAWQSSNSHVCQHSSLGRLRLGHI